MVKAGEESARRKLCGVIESRVWRNYAIVINYISKRNKRLVKWNRHLMCKQSWTWAIEKRSPQCVSLERPFLGASRAARYAVSVAIVSLAFLGHSREAKNNSWLFFKEAFNYMKRADFYGRFSVSQTDPFKRRKIGKIHLKFSQQRRILLRPIDAQIGFYDARLFSDNKWFGLGRE